MFERKSFLPIGVKQRSKLPNKLIFRRPHCDWTNSKLCALSKSTSMESIIFSIISSTTSSFY